MTRSSATAFSSPEPRSCRSRLRRTRSRRRSARCSMRLRRSGREEALRESQELLEQAQQVAHVGSWIYEGGADTDVSAPPPRRIWSKEMYKILGLPEGSAPRHEQYMDRIHPEDVERVAKVRDSVGDPNVSHAVDHRIIRPDGTIRC